MADRDLAGLPDGGEPDDFDDSVCEGDCCQPDDDAGHGDAWAEAWEPLPVVDVLAFAERGLL